MKKLQLFVFLSLISLFASSQNTFFKWYITDRYEYIYNAIEILDGTFVLSGSVSSKLSNNENAYLLKVDRNGNKLLETAPYINDSTSSNSLLFQLPGGPQYINTLAVSSIIRNDNVISSQSVVKFSAIDLTKIEQYNYYSEPNVKIIPQSILLTDNNIYTSSVYFPLKPYPHPAGFVVTKYNKLFDSITSYTELIHQLNPFGIWRDAQTGGIKTFGYVHGTDTYAHNFTSNLKLTGINKLTPFTTSVSATNFYDNKYLLTGTINTNYGLETISEIYVKKYNVNDQITDSVFYHNNPDTILYAGAVCNTALVGDKIFVAGVYNIIPGQFPFQNQPSWIQVTRLDTALNIIDHHFYGGDAYYHPYKILATSDGGALIVGNRYDYTKPSERLYHAFALKINSKALITASPDYPEAKSHDAIVYPNPGRDYLIIQSGLQINGALFTLFDMQGRPVLEELITSTQIKVNTSQLSAGVYPWRITYKNKVIESGKWIKK